MPSISQYMLGQVNVVHKNKRTTTAVGSDGFDISSRDLGSLYYFDTAYVIAGYQHRPDLISDIFYKTPVYWWLILWYNNIDDPFEGLNLGDQIKIPRL
mgnify:FL=1|tara:strand:- start:133 stop:426 length:294 start_codon:yes stop_codon:yes gene_type:complete